MILMEQTKFNQLIQVGLLVVKVLVIVFAITGSVQLFKAIFKTVAFDEYPLGYVTDMATPTPDGKFEKQSEKEIASARKLQMLEDYSGSISMLLVAGGLFWLGKKKEN